MPASRIDGSASSDAGGSCSSTGSPRRQHAPGDAGVGGDARRAALATTGSELISERLPSSWMSSSAAASASSTSRVRARICRAERVEVALRQRGVGDRLQAADRQRRPLGLRRAPPRSATSRSRRRSSMQPVADVGQARVEHQLAVALDDPDHRLAAQLRPVGAVDRHAHLEVARAALARRLEQVAPALDELRLRLGRDAELLERAPERFAARAARAAARRRR